MVKWQNQVLESQVILTSCSTTFWKLLQHYKCQILSHINLHLDNIIARKRGKPKIEATVRHPWYWNRSIVKPEWNIPEYLYAIFFVLVFNCNHFEMRLLNLRINFYLLQTFCPHLGSLCVVSSFTTFRTNFTSGLLQVIYRNLG